MNKIMPLSGILLIFAFLLSGCLTPDTGNGTQNTTALSAQYGDTVTVDYTLTVEGKVLDTSVVDAAKSAGIYNQNQSYQPLTFQMLLGNSTIDGFVNGVIGMKAGDSKNFTVAPADGYGLADPKLITNMSRYYNMSLFEEVPLGFVLSAIASNSTLQNNTVLSTEVGYVAVVNYTNSSATLKYLFYEGHQFAVNGLPQTVINITNDTVLIRFDMEANRSYVVTDPYTKQKGLGRITYADNQTIVLDENPYLAGKELHFEVTMRSIIRTQQ